jgi:uncharacterized membrane protein YfcA
MDIWVALFLFAAGVVAGGLNAVAGGASFFTFPALILAGLPPLVANATNFVALVPGNIAALPAFRNELRLLGRSIWLPLFIAAMGGLSGALLLINLGGGLFADAVPYLMAAATVLFASAPYIRRAVARSSNSPQNTNSLVAMGVLFVFSVYGGYFGAGLGQIILAALILNGYEDFHLSNALKNCVIASISLFSVLVYALSGSVSWMPALFMMAGAALGGFAGGAFSKFVSQ